LKQLASVIVITALFAALPAQAQLDPTNFTSLGTLTVSSGDTVAINTSTGVITINGSPAFTSSVTQSQTSAASIRVFTFANINIASGATITVTGSEPLALLSQGTASVLSDINVSGQAGNGTNGVTTPGNGVAGGGNGGAGASVTGVAASNGVSTFGSNGGTAVQSPDPAFGGQDGAGGGNGGPGGAGGSTAGAATGVSPKTTLVGGGGGSGGPFVNTTLTGPEPGAGGGAGGGAVEIIATGAVTVNNLISNGGAGGGVQPVNSGLQYGGGGAGGSFLVGGSSLTVNGAINANGGAAVNGTDAGSGGGGAVSLLGTPNWVLGSTDTATGLGITVNVNRGVGGSANGTAGTIDATTIGVTAPSGQTATWNGTAFTNVIPVQTQTPTQPAITITLGNNLTLDGGTLQFTGANQTFGPGNTFNVTANSGIIDTNGFNDTVSSIITGPGGITKVGGGTLTLSGDNNFAGSMTMNAGDVVVANANALGSGELIQFAGNLETDNINHIINVGNSVNMQGGNLVLNLNGAPGSPSNDQMNITGAALFNGNLVLNYHGGPISTPETYTVVTTTGGFFIVGGGFTAPTVHAGALNVTAVGFENGLDFDVTLNVTQGLFGTLGGLTPNQRNLASYVDRFDGAVTSGSPLNTLVTNLDAVSASPAALANALDQLMPLNFARFTSSQAFNGSDFLVEQMDNYLAGHRGENGSFLSSAGHLDYSNLSYSTAGTAEGLQGIESQLLAWNPAPSTGLVNDSSAVLGGVDMKDTKAMRNNAATAENPWNVFVAGDAQLGQDFSDQFTGTSHADSTTGEVRVGADYAVMPHFLAGALVDFAHTDDSLDENRSRATLDSYMPAVYASYSDSGWYANAMGGYAFNSYTQSRNVSFAGLTGHADSAPTGGEILGDMDGGYDFHFGAFTAGPTVGLKYIHLDVNGYSENGLPSDDLSVNRDEADSLRARIGGRLSYVMNCHGVVFTPHFDVSYQHEFMDSVRGVDAQIAGATPGAGTFTVLTPAPSRESALMNLGLDAKLDDTFTVFGNYTVQAGQDEYMGQAIQVGVKIGF
jgi:outer membrane autotransporter protein